jgi:hypothetical protein
MIAELTPNEPRANRLLPAGLDLPPKVLPARTNLPVPRSKGVRGRRGSALCPMKMTPRVFRQKVVPNISQYLYDTRIIQLKGWLSQAINHRLCEGVGHVRVPTLDLGAERLGHRNRDIGDTLGKRE